MWFKPDRECYYYPWVLYTVILHRYHLREIAPARGKPPAEVPGTAKSGHYRGRPGTARGVGEGAR